MHCSYAMLYEIFVKYLSVPMLLVGAHGTKENTPEIEDSCF